MLLPLGWPSQPCSTRKLDSRKGSVAGVKPWVGPPRGKIASAQIAIPRALSRARLVKSLIGISAVTSGAVIAHTCDGLTSGSFGPGLTTTHPGAGPNPGGGGAEARREAAAAPVPTAPSSKRPTSKLLPTSIVEEYERQHSRSPLTNQET